MDIDFAAPFRCLSVGHVAAVFGLVLQEAKLVFLSTRLALLTQVNAVLYSYVCAYLVSGYVRTDTARSKACLPQHTTGAADTGTMIALLQEFETLCSCVCACFMCVYIWPCAARSKACLPQHTADAADTGTALTTCVCKLSCRYTSTCM